MSCNEELSFIHKSFSEKDQSQESMENMDALLKREIHLARNIQTKLLNGKKPEFIGGEVTGSSLPARLIGGDYFDFYQLMNGKIRIVIGDVMGKGIPAAMLMILTRGAFRSAAESTKGPGETLTAMNNALCEDLRSLRSFVTVFCADWDPNTGYLTYANAGHNLPLHIKGNEKEVVEIPKVSGIMVGGLPNQIYKEEKIKLAESDVVFFYTDGIIEAQNRHGEQFKKERLLGALLEHSDKSVGDVEKCILEAIHAFTEDVPQKDDITMVILKNSREKPGISSFNSPVINQ